MITTNKFLLTSHQKGRLKIVIDAARKEAQKLGKEIIYDDMAP